MLTITNEWKQYTFNIHSYGKVSGNDKLFKIGGDNTFNAKTGNIYIYNPKVNYVSIPTALIYGEHSSTESIGARSIAGHKCKTQVESIALGANCFAYEVAGVIGWDSKSSGVNSICTGTNNIIYGTQGFIGSGYCNGIQWSSSTTVFGEGNCTAGSVNFMIGRLAKDLEPNTDQGTSNISSKGTAFVIGSGYGIPSTPDDVGAPTDTNRPHRQNVFRVKHEGDVFGFKAYVTGGADYAEFIKEWHDEIGRAHV